MLGTRESPNAPLPFAFIAAFIARLSRRDDVQFITYDDLCWSDDLDYEHGYPVEWAAWKNGCKTGKIDAEKIHILLQHDTDGGPGETLRLANYEAERGVRSTIMTFVNWRGREYLWESLEELPELRPYSMDWQGLKELENKRFGIGYHCNAMHNAAFDADLAYELFASDIAALRRNFSISYFSPHGGRRGPNGETNNSLNYPAVCGTDARWIYNRYAPHFHGAYSDGGLTARIAAGTAVDPRIWLGSLQPGRRYRTLIYAQHYADNFKFVAADASTVAPWYLRFVELAHAKGVEAAADEFWDAAA